MPHWPAWAQDGVVVLMLFPDMRAAAPLAADRQALEVRFWQSAVRAASKRARRLAGGAMILRAAVRASQLLSAGGRCGGSDLVAR